MGAPVFWGATVILLFAACIATLIASWLLGFVFTWDADGISHRYGHHAEQGLRLVPPDWQ
jgi:hypothetical protein